MARQSLTATHPLVPIYALKGRGAVGNMAHRYSVDARQQYDDGWDTLAQQALSASEKLPPSTQVIPELAKSAITTNDSPDIYFDYAVNPYRGCEHGCIYCYARPTHSYLNLSPGLDFETKIMAKTNIAEVLRSELARKSYTPKLINIGSATDCYQPVERELKLTRGLIALLSELNHPFALVTKSSLVERDLDLIAPMAAKKLAAVYVTMTTLDADLARILEPRAAAPHRRLRLIENLTREGIHVGVSVAPQIPFITEDMEKVLQAAAQSGAKSAFYTVLRLPWEVSPLFRQWLAQHYPQRLDRVMARVQELRGGQDYDARFASRMKGQGPWADLLRRRFEMTVKQLGLNRERAEHRIDLFSPPRPMSPQNELF